MPSSRGRRAAARRAAARRRRRLGILVAVVVALGAGLAMTVRQQADSVARPAPESLERRSRTIPDRGQLTIGSEPDRYRLVYRVETFGGGERVVTRDELTVRRPFDGRTIKRSGARSDSAVRSEQVGALGRLFVPASEESDGLLVDTGPSLSPSDLRLAPALGALRDEDLVEDMEWREIGDEPCKVVRFAGPVSSGTLPTSRPSERDYADVCVSERGLVLEEVWVEDGLVQRYRVATSMVLDDVGIGDRSFPIEDQEVLPVERGGGSFRPVATDSSYEAPFWVLDRPPLARHLGRWAVVLPAVSDPEDEETEKRRQGFVADIWQEGIDVLVVEQGSTAGEVEPFQLGSGRRLEVGGLGEGEVVLDLRMNEIRFLRPAGYFVRIRGTLAPDRLEQVARELRRTEGGTGLDYLDG